MSYRHVPLFPPSCGSGSTMCIPLFDGCDCTGRREDCQTVRIQNPACPGEYADVELCVDCDGNLSICVKRPRRYCAMPGRCRKKPHCDCPPWYR